MAAYVDGDARAFDALFSRWAARLSAFFARALGSGSPAEDALQTTFLKLHSARASYQRDLPFRPWLYGIAARARADELRRRYRTKRNVADGDVSELSLVGDDGVALGEKAELKNRVRRAIAALPEGARNIVLLHRYEGLTFGEIATVLSEAEDKAVAEGAVRVRAFRAYEALRKSLADLESTAGAPGAAGADDNATLGGKRDSKEAAR